MSSGIPESKEQIAVRETDSPELENLRRDGKARPMSSGIPESKEQIAVRETDSPELENLLELSFSRVSERPVRAAGKPGTPNPPAAFASEEDLLREAVLALQAIRYGSVLLVVHDGHLVEITKTVKIRRSPATSQGRDKQSKDR